MAENPYAMRLLDGEKVLLAFAPHWTAYLAAGALCVLCWGACLGAGLFYLYPPESFPQVLIPALPWLSAALWLTGGLPFCFAFWRNHSKRYVLTDQRLLLDDLEREIHHRTLCVQSISRVEIAQTTIQRLLATGGVVVHLAGTRFRITPIPYPERFARQLNRLLELENHERANSLITSKRPSFAISPSS